MIADPTTHILKNIRYTEWYDNGKKKKEVLSDGTRREWYRNGEEYQEQYQQNMYRGSRFDITGDLHTIQGQGDGHSYFGKGMYLSESKLVAQNFRNAGYDELERVVFRGKDGAGHTYKDKDNISEFLAELARREIKREKGDKLPDLQEIAQELIRKELDKLKTYQSNLEREKAKPDNKDIISIWRKHVRAQKEYISRLKHNIPQSVELSRATNGNVYTFDGPENYELLDWNAPISAQSDKIQKALTKSRLNLRGNATGQQLYEGLQEKFGGGDKGADKASAWLNKQGIPGLRYLNKYTHGVPEDTHDFVIWDTDLLKLLDVEGDARENFRAADEQNTEAYSQAVRKADEFALTYEAYLQMEEVRKKYEGTPQWMKAPNGKDTNLIEKQWLVVRTPNFKIWFGDLENEPNGEYTSKVLDENGEPRVVYHGSNNLFSVFKTKGKGQTEGTGVWFTSSLENATGFSKGESKDVYHVFLNIRNPYYYHANKKHWDWIGIQKDSLYTKNNENNSYIYADKNGQPFNSMEDAVYLSLQCFALRPIQRC